MATSRPLPRKWETDAQATFGLDDRERAAQWAALRAHETNAPVYMGRVMTDAGLRWAEVARVELALFERRPGDHEEPR